MKKQVIALTGGIGSGKSTVASILRDKGFQIVDCDALSKEIAGTPEVLSEISSAFGKRFVEGGALKRRELARHIFGDAEKTAVMNGIFHDRIFRLLKEKTAESQQTVFVEIQLMPFGTENLFDCVWRIEAPEEIRLSRAKERDGKSEEEIGNIIKRQKDFATSLNTKTEILCNVGNLDELRKNVDELLERSLV